MSKLRVHGFTLSLDGYAAGPNQDLDHPLGVGGHELHRWAFATRTFQQMFGADGGSTGIDDEFAARGFGEYRGLDYGTEYVRTGPWILARRQLERLVG